MTHRLDVACSRELAERWCALAERRLDHLTELYESGRWRRYYTEQSLFDDLRNAKAAVLAWRSLSEAPLPAARARPVLEPLSVAPRVPTSWLPPAAVQAKPIELPRSLETVLAESEIIVPIEDDVAEDGLDAGLPAEDDFEVELTLATPRIDMTALAEALSVGIGPDADDDAPLVELDAIERRYPALAVAY